MNRSFPPSPGARQAASGTRGIARTRPRFLPRTAKGGQFIRGLAGVAAFLALGEVAGRTGLVGRAYLPPSSAVLARMTGLLGNGGFHADVAVTVTAWASGLLLALVAAVPLGLLFGSVPVVNSAARALVEFLRPIPSVALIPLVLLLLADQAQIERLLAAYGAAWPILINTMYAVGEVDPAAREMARSFGFGGLAILWRVVLPSVAPFVATGTRVASAIALIIPISTEMIAGGDHGIGVFILNASTAVGHADVVIAAAAVTGGIGFLIDLAFRHAERRMFGWHFARLGVAA